MIKKILIKLRQFHREFRKLSYWERLALNCEIKKLQEEISAIQGNFYILETNYSEFRRYQALLVIIEKQQKLLREKNV